VEYYDVTLAARQTAHVVVEIDERIQIAGFATRPKGRFRPMLSTTDLVSPT